MNFFVDKNVSDFDTVMSAETLMKSDADYYRDRFQAIADLRKQDDGTAHKGAGFRRVASFVNVPMFMATRMTEPDFLKDKKRFYAFIDRHPEYCTYQRRNGGKPTAKDDLALPLKALGLDYPGGPETAEGWDAVDVPIADFVEPVIDTGSFDSVAPTDNAEVAE